MRILWISPEGKGWAIAHKLREAGNKVVYYNPSNNQNGLGYLPRVTEATWLDYARRSDLIVLDDTPESRRTRRSYAPSDLSTDLQTLRRRGTPILGPTPTTELFQNDTRYCRKLLRRHGLTEAVGQRDDVSVTVSRDPNGKTFLVWRHRTLLGDGNGPDIGNLGDVVLPIASTEPLISNTLGQFEGFLDTVEHRGYLNLALSVTETDIQVNTVSTGFLYPAVFVQFAHLLVPGHDSRIGAGSAVTVLNLEPDQRDTPRIEQGLQDHGVFGGEVHRESEERGAVLHGRYVFAVCGFGDDRQTMERNVNTQLTRLLDVYPGLGFRPGVGHSVLHHLSLLQLWGYVGRSNPTQEKIPQLDIPSKDIDERRTQRVDLKLVQS